MAMRRSHQAMAAELEVDNLSLGFSGLRVLRDIISFSAEAGELAALIGPNGAGKTSLFNCISGIYATPDMTTKPLTTPEEFRKRAAECDRLGEDSERRGA
jgi:ABC-type branched-subunit amino acid transport system ATPase component